MKQNYLGLENKFLLCSICLSLFIFLTSCDSPIPPDPPLKVDISPEPISDNLVARIYFDATLSMQGFVVPGSTRYTRICPYLESVIVSGWRDETVNFFRFGEKVDQIDRSTYLQAGYESFYEEEYIFGKTYIGKVIENEAQFVKTDNGTSSAPTDTTQIDANDTPQDASLTNNTVGQLAVIVTDLFQDDSDINKLIDLLKEKYIQKGCEVGLFGLRSQFDGTVYDIGIGEGSSMRYQNTPGNPETFRPFYLLVLGKHADIAHYFNRLKANGFSEAKTIIFSQYLVESLLTFESEELVNLNRDTIAKRSYPRVKEYRITDKRKQSQISDKLELELLPHVVSFAPEEFNVDIIAEYKPDPEAQSEVSLEAQQCLEVKSTLTKTDNGNELGVVFNLDSPSLPNRRIYLYEVTLQPGIDTFKEPEWCSEWNMGDQRNGARTLNLLNFVHGLLQATALIHEPIIARFHFYIEKR